MSIPLIELALKDLISKNFKDKEFKLDSHLIIPWPRSRSEVDAALAFLVELTGLLPNLARMTYQREDDGQMDDKGFDIEMQEVEKYSRATLDNFLDTLDKEGGISILICLSNASERRRARLRIRNPIINSGESIKARTIHEDLVLFVTPNARHIRSFTKEEYLAAEEKAMDEWRHVSTQDDSNNGSEESKEEDEKDLESHAKRRKLSSNGATSL